MKNKVLLPIKTRELNQSQLSKIFTIWQQQNPQPKTELIYPNNYCLLIAIVLSAQSTDIAVNKATKDLFAIADDAKKMIALGEDNLKKYIKNIGLYNGKAHNIIKLSQSLIDNFEGEPPNNFDKLFSLAGVGRKTAGVFLNCAFHYPIIAVDTHVFRVANRIGIIKEENIKKSETALNKKIKEPWKKDAHHWMILHGRYICKARKALCLECKISDYCNYYKNISAT